MRLILLCLLLALPAAAQPLASATSQWLFNPGAEHSHVVGTGKLLGAGQFRVALDTHLLVERAETLSLREHVTAAWAPLSRLQVMAQVPVVLLQRPLRAPEQGVGRPPTSPMPLRRRARDARPSAPRAPARRQPRWPLSGPGA